MLRVLLALIALACSSCGSKPVAPVDESDQIFPLAGDYAASHILVAYQGAERADETITRTAEEAQALAAQLLTAVLADPGSFEQVARASSDGETARVGGNLGSWKKGQFVPEFDEVVAGLPETAISPKLLETRFGFHIIRRNSISVKHYAARGFFISFKGHPRNPPDVKRSRQEAEELAQSMAGKITENNFEKYAANHNDLGDGPMFLGVMRAGDELPAGALEQVQALKYGEVGGPVAFPNGYVFMQRVKVERRAGAGILIAYQGADSARPVVIRTKQEALQLAHDLIATLAKQPNQFAELAQEHSDEPTASEGGDMGVWFRGEMLPEFGRVLEELEPGEIASQPAATRFGYYIIKRNSVP